MARLATETVKVELKPTDRRLLTRIAKALEKIAEGGPPMGLTFSQVAKEAPVQLEAETLGRLSKIVLDATANQRYDADAMFHTSTPSGRPIETL